jgi:hypothetical protein
MIGEVPHSDEAFLSDNAGYAVFQLATGYSLKVRGIHGVRIYHLIGSFTDGLWLDIDTGFDSTKLPPEIRQTVFQIAGHLYEYREILTASNVNEQPMWLNQVMSGFWLPRT